MTLQSRARVAIAMQKIDYRYRPTPLSVYIPQVMGWLNDKDDEDLALSVFEAVAESERNKHLGGLIEHCNLVLSEIAKDDIVEFRPAQTRTIAQVAADRGLVKSLEGAQPEEPSEEAEELEEEPASATQKEAPPPKKRGRPPKAKNTGLESFTEAR